MTAPMLRAERIRLHREVADVYLDHGMPEKAEIEDAIADSLAGLTRMDAEIEAVAAQVLGEPCPTCGGRKLRTPEDDESTTERK